MSAGRSLTIALALVTAAAAVETGSVLIAWNPNPEPDVSGYKVHLGTESGVYTTTFDVGPTTEAEIPGLAPDLTYYCAVTAYDAGGLESDYSEELPITYTPPAAGEVSRMILAEAEAGTLTAPMVVRGSGEVSWVESETWSRDGSVAIAFEAETAARYVVWCRLQAPSNGADSFFVSLDDGTEDIFHVYGTARPPAEVFSTRWTWRRIHLPGGPAREYSLGAGPHVLNFRTREAGTKLDRLILATDPDFVPSDEIPRSGEVISIVGQPSDLSVSRGSPARLEVAAVATGSLRYQWMKDGMTLGEETDAVLEIPAAGAADAGTYSVVLRAGEMVLTSRPADLSVLAPPVKVERMIFGPDHSITFKLSGTDAASVQIHASSDLDDWTLIATESPVAGELTIMDPARGESRMRYYRLEIP